MKRIILSLFAILFSTQTFAKMNQASTQIEGIFEMTAGKPYLRGIQGQLRLEVSSTELEKDLARLRPGDFITGQGTYFRAENRVALKSIDTVGLRGLLGAWRSRKGDIIEFKDFFLCRVYSPFANATTKAVTRVLNYTLAPDDGGRNRWSIFMADSTSLLIGHLEFGSTSIWLRLYDPNASEPSRVIELSPLR